MNPRSGLVAIAAEGSVDFVICDVFINYLRQQVFDGTVTFDKVNSFCDKISRLLGWTLLVDAPC